MLRGRVRMNLFTVPPAVRSKPREARERESVLSLSRSRCTFSGRLTLQPGRRWHQGRMSPIRAS